MAYMTGVLKHVQDHNKDPQTFQYPRTHYTVPLKLSTYQTNFCAVGVNSNKGAHP